MSDRHSDTVEELSSQIHQALDAAWTAGRTCTQQRESDLESQLNQALKRIAYRDANAKAILGEEHLAAVVAERNHLRAKLSEAERAAPAPARADSNLIDDLALLPAQLRALL